MSARGIPVQDLPENQDPSVRYTVDEMTGKVTPFDAPAEKPKKRAAPAPKKEATSDAPAEGDGE